MWEVRAPARNGEGRSIQVSRTVQGTKREAEAALRKLLTEVDQGHHRERKRTVRDLMEKWFALVEPDRSPATVRRYRSNLDQHILPGLGAMLLERLGPGELDDFYVDRRKNGKLAPSSVRVLHQVLGTAFKYGVNIGWLVTSPAARATPPKQRVPEIHPPGWDDLALLVKVAMERDVDLAVLIFLAASTGARRGELCGLRWEDVTAYQLNIWRGVVDLGESRTLVKETKHRRYRTIALAPEVSPFLAAHRRRMELRAADAGVALAEHAFVFSNRPTCGLPLSPASVTNRFIDIRDRAGLPDVRLHDLRHLHASFLFEAGFDAVTIGGRLGHAGGQLAHDLYGHFAAARDGAAGAALGAVLPALPLDGGVD